MKDLVSVAFVILIVAVLAASAQTSADLQRMFGKPLEAFEVRPNILMTVQYDKVGNVAMITFEAKHAQDMTVSSKNSFSYPSVLSGKEIDELLENVAPQLVRGKRLYRGSFNSSANGIYMEEFQHLSIHRAGASDGLYSVQVRWKRQ